MLVIHLPGSVTDEWSRAIAEEVATKLPRVNGASLILDFSHVELINSLGVTCLLQVDEDARRRGAKVHFAAMPPAIWQFFKQIKLDRRFTPVASVEAALAQADRQV